MEKIRFREKTFDMYLGIDSSTQSLTAVILDSKSGEITCQLSVNFGSDLPHYNAPSGFIPGGANGEVHADPLMWIEALDLLFSRLAKETDLSKIKIISGSGQQHGSIYVDESFESRLSALDPTGSLAEELSPALTRKTSPIWMDTSTGSECAEITASVGSPEEVCSRSGSVAIERFTGPQIRRFSKTAPTNYERTSQIYLVS
ncbi:MAG: carbohydrate kinase, partial [Akkermansiaceae bacterium]|nr:carbohydrate kinase [Akkermansiaceae bacterium]